MMKDDYRERSRSPFRKNFNERSYNADDHGKLKGRRRDRSADGRRAGGGGGGGSSKNRVFVNNIPFECRWMEIKDLFREKVGVVEFVELFEDDAGKFKGCGVVEFKDHESALKAVEVVHKHEIRGRQLNVKLESGELERRRASARPAEREFMRGGDNFNNDFRPDQSYNTYGLNPKFLASLGILGPLNSKVFISNLDYKVTEKKLEEIFKIAGKISKVELNVGTDGKSKGHGTAEYEHPLEAVQAISMFNGQRLFARIINVRMDKFVEDSDSIPSKLPSGLHGIGKGLGMSGNPMQFSKNATGPTGSFGFGMGLSDHSLDQWFPIMHPSRTSSTLTLNAEDRLSLFEKQIHSGNSSGMPNSGMGGSSSLMLNSSGMGLSSSGSMGMSNSMTSDRMMGMGGLSSSSLSMSSPSMGMGMGGSSSMMSNSNMMHSSSMDGMGRDAPYSLSRDGGSRSFRDGFDRGNDSFGNSRLSDTDTVLVGNLPSTFSWQALKDRFRDVGEIRYADMKGQGSAIIRFFKVQDAQRAVDLMNGYRIDGRAIQVRFY